METLSEKEKILVIRTLSHNFVLPFLKQQVLDMRIQTSVEKKFKI